MNSKRQRANRRIVSRPRFSRTAAVLAAFVVLTTVVSGASWYRNYARYSSHAAGGWQSGASGEGVPDGSFAAWRGSPVYIAGTWSVWGLRDEYLNWNGDLDVGVWGAGTDDNFIGWGSAASGGADSIWSDEFGVVRTWLSNHSGRTVYMRFAYEYNGNFMPYNVSSGDIGNFITAFRRWADKCHAISGCKTVWANNEGSGGQYNPSTAWPGDQYVDVVGVDTYNQYPYSGSVSAFQSNRLSNPMGSGETGLEAWRTFAQSHGKPLSIPEWGNCSNPGGEGGGGDSPGYIQGMHDWMAANAGSGPGQIIYDVYFNVTSGYSCNFYLYPTISAQANAANMYKSLNWGNGGLAGGGGGGGGSTPTPVPTSVPQPGSEVQAAGNLLAGKAFSSSVGDSTSEAGHPVSYLTDGNGATRWISQPTSPVTLTADMGASYTLNKVSIKWAGDTVNHFQIQTSPDNTTWTTVVTDHTNNTSPEYHDYTQFSATPTGRYFRIVGTDRWNSSYGNSIWEVGAYGTSAADRTPPSVQLTAPAANAAVKGSVSVTGTASDNVGVTRVDLLVDGAVRATNTSSSANFSWSSTTVADGNHTLALKATDAAGNAATTPATTVTVSNTSAPPAPTIQSFVANPSSVTAGGRANLTWVTTGVSTCSINPGGPQNTSSTYWQTPSLMSVGSISYTLTCQNPTGQTVSKALAISVGAPTSLPNKPVLVATSTIVPSGSSVTLSWASPGASSCTLGPVSVTGSGSMGSYVTSPLTSTTTYVVTCQNSIGTIISNPVTVTISGSSVPSSAPVIVSLFADPARIAAGQTSTIYWTTTGVSAGGCNLNPSPLNTTGPNGTWTTPYLLGSKSYTLTCVGSDTQVVSKSVDVIVNDIAVNGEASSVTPITNTANSTQQYLTASNGQQIMNGAVATKVAGLVTLDPSNVTNSTKEKSITKVEYYEGEKLIQTDSIAPFALDSTKLSNGSHTITERTYYVDGSKSEVVRILSVYNTKPISNKSSAGTIAIVVIMVLVLLLGGGAGVYFLMHRKVSVDTLRSRYGNTIDASLLDQP